MKSFTVIQSGTITYECVFVILLKYIFKTSEAPLVIPFFSSVSFTSDVSAAVPCVGDGATGDYLCTRRGDLPCYWSTGNINPTNTLNVLLFLRFLLILCIIDLIGKRQQTEETGAV